MLTVCGIQLGVAIRTQKQEHTRAYWRILEHSGEDMWAYAKGVEQREWNQEMLWGEFKECGNQPVIGNG